MLQSNKIFYMISVALATLLFLSGCATRKIKDVSYDVSSKNQLNIFRPEGASTAKLPVLIFIHGGNWNSGNKNTYGFLGRNFAKRRIVTVIPDYTLSPAANYDTMAMQVASAIQWVKAHISESGGDPERIYITGHSAGGHLAALAVMNPKYGIDQKWISGIILNDAAGLDMKNYLTEYPPSTTNDYLATWSADAKQWEDASPIYFINDKNPPFMVYVGNKTYKSIKIANQHFLEALHSFQSTVLPVKINKSHIPMVLQYAWPCSKRFEEIGAFMAKTKLK